MSPIFIIDAHGNAKEIIETVNQTLNESMMGIRLRKHVLNFIVEALELYCDGDNMADCLRVQASSKVCYRGPEQ